MNQKKDKTIIFYIIFSLAGILMLIMGYVFLIRTMRFQKNAVEVTVVISAIERYTDSDGNTNHRVFVDYDFDGVHYHDVQLSEYNSSMREGKQLTMLVDPEDPLNVQGKMSRYIAVIVLMIMGIVFAAVGIVPAVRSVIKRQDGERLMQEGRRLEGVVESFIQNYNISINGRHPYIIICIWQDMYQDVIYRFKSENLWTNPQPVFQVGDRIDIYVQGDNYKKYYVDAKSRLNQKLVDYT